MDEQMEKTEHKGKKGPVIAATVLAVLLCAYLGLCAWVGSQKTIFPNIFVLGQDVSGMTVEDAQAAVEQGLDAWGNQVTATLCYNGWRGSVTAAQMRDQWTDVADPAGWIGRGNFFTQGGQYLAHLMGTTYMVQVPRSPENPALEQLLDQMEREVGGSVVQASYQVDGDRLSMTKGRTGVVIDRAEARKAALSAMDEALSLKFFQGQEGNAEVERELEPAETPPQTPDFNAIYRELHTEAKSAEMDPTTYEITDHVVGVDFDVRQLESAYGAAAEGETFDIPLTLTQPTDTKASLTGKLFKDLLGQGTTTVSGSANRKHNVKLSAQACNGVILLPGEEFSYNNTTGSRTASKGYLAAPVYSGGASVDEVGGGICQTSSTIYFAVLHTDLEVVERKNHMYNTGYVDPGMDATVYYGSTDFRFKNNSPYPVKIVTESYDQGGKRKLTVKLYGTNPDGVYAVPKSEVFDLVTPTTKYQADSGVPRGSLVLDKKQNAYTGRSAQTYRYVYSAGGTLLEKQNMGFSKYAMRPNLYHYNPADGDPSTWVNGVPPTAPTDTGTTTDRGDQGGQTTETVIPTDPADQGGQTTGTDTPTDPTDQGGQTTDPNGGGGEEIAA